MRDYSVYSNNTIKGQEVYSRYTTDELVNKLRGYNRKDALIMLDVDDTLRDSPAKKAAWHCLGIPILWMHRPEWIVEPAGIIVEKLLKGKKIQDAEADCFEYCMKNILPNYPGLIEELLEVNWTPLYSGVKEVVGLFDRANKVIVSQNVEQVVNKTRQELGIRKGYYRARDKLMAVREHCKDKRIEHFLIIGNSQEDYSVGGALRGEGYDVEVVAVKKRLNGYFENDATVYIPRNWQGLEKLIK
ncbi:hypothetical protein HYX11_03265 [Candidatus Woesearchaeota archaeon]|nr:hypothetical protein [Candidatus Woesearchaeota archaeon]